MQIYFRAIIPSVMLGNWEKILAQVLKHFVPISRSCLRTPIHRKSNSFPDQISFTEFFL